MAMPEQNSSNPDSKTFTQDVPVAGQHGDSADEAKRDSTAVPGNPQDRSFE